MRNYRLVYRQPYDCDDDSPSGIGDHNVEYAQQSSNFVALNDADARKQVEEFIKVGGLNFGHHMGSPPAGYYPRQFVSLVEFKPDRIVRFEEANHANM